MKKINLIIAMMTTLLTVMFSSVYASDKAYTASITLDIDNSITSSKIFLQQSNKGNATVDNTDSLCFTTSSPTSYCTQGTNAPAVQWDAEHTGSQPNNDLNFNIKIGDNGNLTGIAEVKAKVSQSDSIKFLDATVHNYGNLYTCTITHSKTALTQTVTCKKNSN